MATICGFQISSMGVASLLSLYKKRIWDIWEDVNGLYFFAPVIATLSLILYYIVFLRICPGSSETFLEPGGTLFTFFSLTAPLYVFLLMAPLNSQILY